MTNVTDQARITTSVSSSSSDVVWHCT